MEIFKKIKPLSINEAFQGRRFKTAKCKFYEQELLLTLPRKELPPKPYSIYFEFGLSSKLADYDNSVKVLQDVLCKKYNFDDRDIMEGRVRKVLVSKGEEYIKVKIESFKE